MFAWERPVKIEKLDPHTRRPTVVSTTPIGVVSQPSGHRAEDITNSLCIIVAEIARTLEAQGKSAMKIQDMLEQSVRVKNEKTAEAKKPKGQKAKTKRKTKRLAVD
jgi:hypothetical protein